MQAAVQRVENEQRTVFIKSSVVGLLLYIIFFAVILFFARLPLRAKTSESAVPILEAELVETIQAPKLHEKLTESVKIKEETVSQDLSKGKQDAGNLKSTTDVQNQTVKSSDPLILTHGPQVISSTIPHLPEYLKNQNLKTNVLIEFLVAADGNSSPSLIGSSGNEELDVIALRAAKSWIFKAALKDGKPIAGKVRLRINFEVQ